MYIHYTPQHVYIYIPFQFFQNTNKSLNNLQIHKITYDNLQCSAQNYYIMSKSMKTDMKTKAHCVHNYYISDGVTQHLENLC